MVLGDNVSAVYVDAGLLNSIDMLGSAFGCEDTQDASS
jgi:hypothetical protein